MQEMPLPAVNTRSGGVMVWGMEEACALRAGRRPVCWGRRARARHGLEEACALKRFLFFVNESSGL